MRITKCCSVPLISLYSQYKRMCSGCGAVEDWCLEKGQKAILTEEIGMTNDPVVQAENEWQDSLVEISEEQRQEEIVLIKEDLLSGEPIRFNHSYYTLDEIFEDVGFTDPTQVAIKKVYKRILNSTNDKELLSNATVLKSILEGAVEQLATDVWEDRNF